MNAPHYNPETCRYWYRKLRSETIDRDVQAESARALSFFGAELRLEQPYPKIQWVRPEPWEVADEEDTKAAVRERELGVPYECDCFHEAEDFAGFTPYRRSHLIFIRIGLAREQLLKTIADEMRHVWQDRQYGDDYRETNRQAAEADAENYVADATPRYFGLYQTPQSQETSKNDRGWFQRKVAELKTELEKLPADRQEQFLAMLDQTTESIPRIMPDLTDYREPVYNMALTLDAMFYHSARACYEKALAAAPDVKDRLKDFEELEAERERIIADYEGNARLDRLEPVYIRMSRTNESIGFAYSPLVEGVACTHILCACALESHINARAKELLTGKILDKFDSVDIEFKWLLLPRLTDKGCFDAGKEPFQSFSRLIKFRNKLVHYRERKEPWGDPGVPTFLEELGLTTAYAAMSIECVSRMISTLAEQLGQEVPYWLQRETGAISCFEFRCEDVEPEGRGE
jgi:hypothetical protein